MVFARLRVHLLKANKAADAAYHAGGEFPSSA